MKSRRRFSPAQKAEVIRRQDGKCACCGEDLGDDVRQIEFDHDKSLWLDGPDTLENLRALKKKHHLVKTRAETTLRAKNNRVRAKNNGKHLTAAQRELQRIMDRRAAR